MSSFSKLPERIQAKIRVTDECWEWLAVRHPDGYGKVWFEGRLQYAHRVTYQILVGEIPDGLVTDHLCRNRGCVRPDHIEPVTQRTNLLRGDTFMAAYAAKDTCPRGHVYDVISHRDRRCSVCSRDSARARYWAKKVKSHA
jgi:hypothetical protein